MSNHIQNAIQSALNSRPNDFKNEITSVIQQKVNNALFLQKMQVANKIFDDKQESTKYDLNLFSETRNIDEDFEDIEEADMSKSELKMAHVIGKHFEKKGVGDKTKGGPYAVATSMVQDKPAAAQKAYATIKAKMKNEEHESILISLYDSLTEKNQQIFLEQFEENAENILNFALSLKEE